MRPQSFVRGWRSQGSRLFLLGLVIVLIGSAAGCRRHRQSATLQDAARAGSKEYDDYVKAGKLKAVAENKQQAESALNATSLTVIGKLVNSGDRTVTGVELHGYTVDLDGKPFLDQSGKQMWHQVYVWMPNQYRKGPLAPGQSEPFSLVITTVPTKRVSEIGDLRVEISGVTFAK